MEVEYSGEFEEEKTNVGWNRGFFAKVTVVVVVVVVEVVVVVVVEVVVVVVVVVGINLSKCSVLSRLLQSSSPHQQTVQLVAWSRVHSGVSTSLSPSPEAPQPRAQPPVTSEDMRSWYPGQYTSRVTHYWWPGCRWWPPPRSPGPRPRPPGPGTAPRDQSRRGSGAPPPSPQTRPWSGMWSARDSHHHGHLAIISWAPILELQKSVAQVHIWPDPANILTRVFIGCLKFDYFLTKLEFDLLTVIFWGYLETLHPTACSPEDLKCKWKDLEYPLNTNLVGVFSLDPPNAAGGHIGKTWCRVLLVII